MSKGWKGWWPKRLSFGLGRSSQKCSKEDGMSVGETSTQSSLCDCVSSSDLHETGFGTCIHTCMGMEDSLAENCYFANPDKNDATQSEVEHGSRLLLLN